MVGLHSSAAMTSQVQTERNHTRLIRLWGIGNNTYVKNRGSTNKQEFTTVLWGNSYFDESLIRLEQL